MSTKSTIVLRGITWNHTRGLAPLQATAQRFHELHPHVEIQWEKRSLQAFADESIESLASRFELLIVDHPSTGEAAAHGVFLPYESHVPAEFLQDQAMHSVGGSHESYRMNGNQWALAIDAASPVAGWRQDLLDQAHEQVPQTWEELLHLARRGMVAFCGCPIDCLMYFYAFCLNEGEKPFGPDKSRIVSEEIGMNALGALKELADLCDPAGFSRNPILTWELLTLQDKAAYCPFAYGYSNYARGGYARRPLRFGGLVSRNGIRLTSTLGGTGLAVSSTTRHRDIAMQYAQYVACGDTQTGIFTQSGGQPGHRTAWLNQENNRQTGQYFRDTLPTLDAAYIRARFDGYIDFQTKAPIHVVDALRGKISLKEAMRRMNALYRNYPNR